MSSRAGEKVVLAVDTFHRPMSDEVAHIRPRTTALRDWDTEDNHCRRKEEEEGMTDHMGQGNRPVENHNEAADGLCWGHSAAKMRRCKKDNQGVEDKKDSPVPSSFAPDAFLEDSARFPCGLHWKVALHLPDRLEEPL